MAADGGGWTKDEVEEDASEDEKERVEIRGRGPPGPGVYLLEDVDPNISSALLLERLCCWGREDDCADCWEEGGVLLRWRRFSDRGEARRSV